MGEPCRAMQRRENWECRGMVSHKLGVRWTVWLGKCLVHLLFHAAAVQAIGEAILEVLHAVRLPSYRMDVIKLEGVQNKLSSLLPGLQT